MHVRADPIILVFVVLGTDNFSVCTIWCESCWTEGMCLGIVVIVTCFVACVILSLLINVFYMYIAIVKRVVLIFVSVLYKSPWFIDLFKKIFRYTCHIAISLFIYFFDLIFITNTVMALLTKLLSNGKSFYQQLCSVAFGYDVMMYSVYFRYHAVMLHIVPFLWKERKEGKKKKE